MKLVLDTPAGTTIENGCHFPVKRLAISSIPLEVKTLKAKSQTLGGYCESTGTRLGKSAYRRATGFGYRSQFDVAEARRGKRSD